jgi:hypothetical protein
MASHEFQDSLLDRLYDALRSDQLSPNEPSSGVAVGALDLRRSAIFLATEQEIRHLFKEAVTNAG